MYKKSSTCKVVVLYADCFFAVLVAVAVVVVSASYLIIVKSHLLRKLTRVVEKGKG